MGVRTDFLHVPTLFDVDLAWFNHIFLCRFLCTFETSQHVTRPGTNLWHCRTGTRKWQCRMGNHIFHWWIIVFTPFFFANESHPTKHPKTWSTIPWISLWHKLPVKKWWVSVNVAAGLAELETWFGSPRSAWQLRGKPYFPVFFHAETVCSNWFPHALDKKRVDGHIRVLDAEKSSFFDDPSTFQAFWWLNPSYFSG